MRKEFLCEKFEGDSIVQIRQLDENSSGISCSPEDLRKPQEYIFPVEHNRKQKKDLLSRGHKPPGKDLKYSCMSKIIWKVDGAQRPLQQGYPLTIQSCILFMRLSTKWYTPNRTRNSNCGNISQSRERRE